MDYHPQSLLEILDNLSMIFQKSQTPEGVHTMI